MNRSPIPELRAAFIWTAGDIRLGGCEVSVSRGRLAELARSGDLVGARIMRGRRLLGFISTTFATQLGDALGGEVVLNTEGRRVLGSRRNPTRLVTLSVLGEFTDDTINVSCFRVIDDAVIPTVALVPFQHSITESIPVAHSLTETAPKARIKQ